MLPYDLEKTLSPPLPASVPTAPAQLPEFRVVHSLDVKKNNWELKI